MAGALDRYGAALVNNCNRSFPVVILSKDAKVVGNEDIYFLCQAFQDAVKIKAAA
jgi:hypothetical protein